MSVTSCTNAVQATTLQETTWAYLYLNYKEKGYFSKYFYGFILKRLKLKQNQIKTEVMILKK